MYIDDEELAMQCECGAVVIFTIGDARRSVEVACLKCGETSTVEPVLHPEIFDIEREIAQYLHG